MSGNPNGTSRTERYLFAGLALLMGIHLLVRTFTVPITYEEALRFFTMVESAGMPQDHLLSVWWARLSNFLFGPVLMPQRLLSLVAYVLFARYTYLLGGLLKPGLVRWCTWLSLLIMPFAVELFALAGGQALAMAFLFMGLWHLAQIHRTTGLRHPLLAVLAFVGVAFSTMALLPAWALGITALFLVLLRQRPFRWKALLLWAMVGIAPGVLLFLGYHTDAATPEIQVTDELRKALELVFGTKAPWLVWSLVLAVVGMAWVAFGMRPDAEHPAERGLLRSVVLLVVCWPLLYLVQLEPTDPTLDLLPWLPLFLLGFGLLVDVAARHASHRRWLALLLLWPAAFMVQGIHVGTTRSSGDGAIPSKLDTLVKELQEKAHRSLVIGGGMRQKPSWEFARLLDAEPISSLQTDQFALESADLLLLSRKEADDVSGAYREIGNGPGGLTLLERKEPFVTTVLVDSALSFGTSDLEFKELPLPPLGDLIGKAIDLDLVGVFSAPNTQGEGQFLVIEVNDADMGHLYYVSRDLPIQRGRKDNAIRLAHTLPTITADAQRVAIYIWNPARVPFSLVNAQVRIHQRNSTNNPVTE